jgi:hypothetical protein
MNNPPLNGGNVNIFKRAVSSVPSLPVHSGTGMSNPPPKRGYVNIFNPAIREDNYPIAAVSQVNQGNRNYISN